MAIREVATRRGQEPVDLENVLTGGADFLEHVHLSPEGTWRAAGAVFARLPLFRQTVQAWLPVLAEQPARLQLTPDGSLLGAAIAAAWACEQR